MMFEVGKKYRLKRGDGQIRECVWVEGDKAILTRATENQGVLFWRTPQSKFYPLLAKVKLTITDDKATSIEIIKEP